MTTGEGNHAALRGKNLLHAVPPAPIRSFEDADRIRKAAPLPQRPSISARKNLTSTFFRRTSSTRRRTGLGLIAAMSRTAGPGLHLPPTGGMGEQKKFRISSQRLRTLEP